MQLPSPASSSNYFHPSNQTPPLQLGNISLAPNDRLLSPDALLRTQRQYGSIGTVKLKTHTSGTAVEAMLYRRPQWPHVQKFNPSDLQARAFEVYEPWHDRYRPATLREVIQAITDYLPKSPMVFNMKRTAMVKEADISLS